MEQSILKNSKGATYMSFILDIEIVIKKEGAHANLAESKAKNKVQKKDPKNTNASSKNKDVQVYAMSTEPQKIFNFPISPQQHDQEALLETHQTSERNSNGGADNSGSTKLSKHVEEKNVMNNEVYSEQKQTPVKKKRITKTDKKAKVFKGKVEEIDFLECNRIFLCNFLKIKKPKNSKLRNGTSLSCMIGDSKLPTLNSTNDNLKSKSLPHPKIQAKQQRPRKLFTLFTRSSFQNFGLSQLPSDNSLINDNKMQSETGEQTTNNDKSTKKYNKFKKILRKKQVLIKNFKSHKSTNNKSIFKKEISSKNIEIQNFEMKYSNQSSGDGFEKNIFSEKSLPVLGLCVKENSSGCVGSTETGYESHVEDNLVKLSNQNDFEFLKKETNNKNSDLEVMLFLGSELKESNNNNLSGNIELKPIIENKDFILEGKNLLLSHLDDSGTNTSSNDLGCITIDRDSENKNYINSKKMLSNVEINVIDDNKTQLIQTNHSTENNSYKFDKQSEITVAGAVKYLRKVINKSEQASSEQVQNAVIPTDPGPDNIATQEVPCKIEKHLQVCSQTKEALTPQNLNF